MKRTILLCAILLSFSLSARSGQAAVAGYDYAKSTARQLETVPEGEVVILANLKEFIQEYPGFLEQHDIPYSMGAYPTRQEIDPMESANVPEDSLIIYKKYGVFHTNQVSPTALGDLPDMDTLAKAFSLRIDSIVSDSAFYENSLYGYADAVLVNSFTQTTSYDGVYEEFGEPVPGRKGKTEDTFLTYQFSDTDPQYDYCMIQRITTVYPYLSKSASYVTSSYSSELAPCTGSAATLLWASPLTNELPISQDSNPVSVSSGMAKKDSDGRYEIRLSNPVGLYRPLMTDGSEGQFSYVSSTEYRVGDFSSFAFQYNNCFTNSTYGNGRVSFQHGGEWHLVRV